MRLAIALCFFAFGLGAASAQAQKVIPSTPRGAMSNAGAGCDSGGASVKIGFGDVRAQLYNLGGLFWRGGLTGYEVPASGPSPIFAHGLWISGDVDGETRFAGSTYGPWEFWPGPLDADGETTVGRCLSFDRFWRVLFDDLTNYTAHGRTSGTSLDLIYWPIAQGAPYFVDTNGNDRRDATEPRRTLGPGDPGYSVSLDEGAVLDLDAGERPDIVGDQAAWWVMNDNGNTHEWSESGPLQVEVQVLAFVFDVADLALSQSTFYEYTVVNRGDTPITGSRVSFFTDIDLGDPDDDYLASDSTRGLLIGYNGDEVDQADRGYGRRPPAIGLDLLTGAAGTMTYVPYEGPAGPEPGDQFQGAIHYQLSRWGDTEPLTRGGDGYDPGSDDVTSWLFDGDPVTYAFWTEEQPVPGGPSLAPGDRKAVLNAPSQTLAPGESRRVDLAILFAEGSRDRTRLHSVSRLRDVSDAVQAAYNAGGTPALREAEVSYAPPPPPPVTAPDLLAPAEDTDYNETLPATVTFEWTAVEGADAYVLTLGDAPDDAQTFQTTATALTLDSQQLPKNLPSNTSWRVRGVNWGGKGPPSPDRDFSYLVYRFGPLLLSDGTPAFVEVEGPGGADPCGPEAESTEGCDEVGGNQIYGSLNSTGDYLGASVNDGPEFSISHFAPADYEIRFTEAGSFAAYVFTTGTAIRVPFEVWDIGVTPPGSENDPSDDIQLIAALFRDGPVECEFGYHSGMEHSVHGVGEITQRIYAYYPIQTYDVWEADIAPLVGAHPDGCPTDPETAPAFGEINISQGRPIQRFVLEQAEGGAEIDALTGTVIRFYTEDPASVAAADDRPGTLALAVHPNPVGDAASVPYALATAGPVRLRVLDVLGREVAVLAEGLRSAGAHRATLNASRLAAGVYVVVLDAGGARVTRTVTVVR